MMISPSEELALERFDNASRTVVPLEFLDWREDAFEQRTAGFVEPEQEEGREIEIVAEPEIHQRSQEQSNEELIERTRQEAQAEARNEVAQESEEKIASIRAMVGEVCKQFAKEKTKYFAGVEAEVVRLALAVAARVLHRETKLDPLLLRGAVRVALERLKENSVATLRIPEEQAEEWKRIIDTAAGQEVEVVADSRMQAGECVIETNVGRVDLGVKAQLEEIERGFFDLLEQRPV